MFVVHYILLRATYHRAPRYGGVRTWVEDLLARGERALPEASNLMGYKNALSLQTNCTDYVKRTYSG